VTQDNGLNDRERWIYAALAALVVLVWLATAASRPLFNPDEGRYSEVPREMLADGDWVIPHLNGLDYIEKPPLQYWATALMYRAFGVKEFSARLYTALTALATVAAVGLLGGRIWSPATGWRAAAVMSGMLIFVILGQLVTLDMSLTFYMTVSLAGFLLGQRSEGLARRWMLVAWIAAALAVLTKGVVAVAIPAAVLLIYSLCSRDFTPWRRLNLKWGLPLFLILVVPWHWLAAQRLDDFLQFFFVHEHLARYLTPSADRQEPWWFFAYVFLIGTVPWTVPALRVIVAGWRSRAPPGQFNTSLFLWIWVLFIGVFFSLSDSKLMPYILPAMPALAVLIAASPTATLRRDFRLTAILTAVVGLALGVASFFLARFIPVSAGQSYFLPLGLPLREIAALLVLSGVFVWIQRARDETRAGVFLGVGWCLAGLLLMRSAALLEPLYSGIDLANAVPPSERDAPIYSVRTYDQSLTFYLRRTVILVSYRGELDYGLSKASGREISDMDEFLRTWESQTRAFALMDRSTFDTFKERGVPMRIIGQTRREVMVARQ
jgi:4-amino-4-deoxy-L-arabinose transferase-like glycosyltransferase